MTAHIGKGTVITVTCAGRPPTLFNSSCGYSVLAVSGGYTLLSPDGSTDGSTCNNGECSF